MCHKGMLLGLWLCILMVYFDSELVMHAVMYSELIVLAAPGIGCYTSQDSS